MQGDCLYPVLQPYKLQQSVRQAVVEQLQAQLSPGTTVHEQKPMHHYATCTNAFHRNSSNHSHDSTSSQWCNMICSFGKTVSFIALQSAAAAVPSNASNIACDTVSQWLSALAPTQSWSIQVPPFETDSMHVCHNITSYHKKTVATHARLSL